MCLEGYSNHTNLNMATKDAFKKKKGSKRIFFFGWSISNSKFKNKISHFIFTLFVLGLRFTRRPLISRTRLQGELTNLCFFFSFPLLPSFPLDRRFHNLLGNKLRPQMLLSFLGITKNYEISHFKCIDSDKKKKNNLVFLLLYIFSYFY